MARKSKIPQLKQSINQEIDRLVFRVAHQIRNNAVESIQRGTKSGREYRRGSVTHRASAPGESPATDTGALVRSIRVDHQPGSGVADVVAAARYAAFLEFGTRKMAARPFLRPAAEKVKTQLPDLVKKVKITVGS